MKKKNTILCMLLAFVAVPVCSSFAAVSLLQSFTETNVSGNSEFGHSVANAGDVNNDTYDDVIVSAYAYNNDTGRAYIFYGGSSMNSTADVTLTGEGTGHLFGYSISGAGDVNADGYDDVIVGAFAYSNNTGRAYIYRGGSSMDNTPDLIMTGEAMNHFFGFSVASADSLVDDTYDAVIVGAYGYNSGVGRAYIYHGGSSLNGVADLTIDGVTAGDLFGKAVASAGDVNNDGYGDVIIGAPGKTSNIGGAYIYFGGASMDGGADVTMDGEATVPYFGFSLSGAGDVDDDGYDDVIVGGYGNDTVPGSAYIYRGGSSMDGAADVTLVGVDLGSYFGYSVSDAGDINGDGYADVIVGAYRLGSYTGRAYIYLGGSTMSTTPAAIITGTMSYDYLGRSVACAGDVNKDGFADVIIGSFGYNNSTGRADIFFGAAEWDNTADVTLAGEVLNNFFGRLVASAGDVNYDGYDDVIVGAPHYNSNTGRAYIYYGSSSMDNTADVILNGVDPGSYFGVSVSGVGNLNGDNYADVIVGAYGIGGATGRVYVYYGGSPMDNGIDRMLTGESQGSLFGYYVASAGDVNDDGFDDVITGAHGLNNNKGRAYIFFGGSPMDQDYDAYMDGETENSFFGFGVSGAGHINDDSYADVIVGAYGHNAGSGRAYIYHGGSTMGDPANLTISGASAGDYLGISVACAGDISGDHFDDVIIGEDGYGSNRGRARIYFGGAGMDAVSDFTFEGEGAGNNFGRAVACAGDVNNDDVADIIIGAPSYGALTGRAYIYFGSSSMTGSADITLTGEAVNSSFGESVSCAGDVNNDGYDDIIIGAPAYLSNGKAYLYGESTPIAVELSSFTAQIQQDGILIKWEAQTETNCAGYNIYRREESASDFIKINETMILSRGTNSQGVTYSYLDTPTAGNYVYKLQSIDLDGSDEFTEPVAVSMTSLVEQPLVPLEFALLQNYPNPFNPQTTIRFDLPASAEVSLVVYDMQGRIVRTLMAGHQGAGVHSAIWNGTDDAGRAVASGLYIYHLTAGEFSDIRKMTLLK